MANSLDSNIKSKLAYVHATEPMVNLIFETVRDVLSWRAALEPDRCAYIFAHEAGGLQLTYSEVERRVTLLAQNMLEMGLQPGDRLAVAVDYAHEFVIAFLAAASIGVVVVLLNLLYKQFEFDHLLRKTAARALLIFDNFGPKSFISIMRQICPEIDDTATQPGQLNSAALPELRHIIVVQRANSGLVLPAACWSFAELASRRLAPDRTHPLPVVNSEDPLMVIFTSGTTGTPKGALHTHFSLLNNIYVSIACMPEVTEWKDSIACIGAPMLSLSGIINFILPSLTHGITFLFPFSVFCAEDVVRALQVHPAAALYGPYRLLNEILNAPGGADLRGLRLVCGFGSAPNEELVSRLIDTYKLERFVNVYGSTECTVVAYNNFTSEEFRNNRRLVERVQTMPNFEVKLIGERDGLLCQRGQIGVLHVRSLMRMVRYYDEPEKTAEAIDANNWVNTGDVAGMDEQGYLFLKNRLKEVIKIYDGSIYPFEIETYLQKHENVKESCVFGVPVNAYEEAICAGIVLRDTTKSTSIEEIKSFCRANFADNKMPRYIRFYDVFPRTAGLGKIAKSQLVDMFKESFNI